MGVTWWTLSTALMSCTNYGLQAARQKSKYSLTIVVHIYDMKHLNVSKIEFTFIYTKTFLIS